MSRLRGELAPGNAPVLLVRRGDDATPADPSLVLHSGDVLVLAGSDEEIQAARAALAASG